MSLRDAPLVYVFLESRQIELQRRFLESVVGLPVIEIEPHLPHHRHGAVKYDAGSLILSLNLSGPTRFRSGYSDGVVTVFEHAAPWSGAQTPLHGFLREREDGLVTDDDGHHWRFGPPARSRPAGAGPTISEVQLAVTDLAASVAFYRDALGLALVELSTRVARVRAGRADLVLVELGGAPDGRAPAYSTSLVVFYVPDIVSAQARLAARGIAFMRPRPGFSEIGGTARFDDPSGHHLCLYEPSEECLHWGSGPTVMEIAGLRRTTPSHPS